MSDAESNNDGKRRSTRREKGNEDSDSSTDESVKRPKLSPIPGDTDWLYSELSSDSHSSLSELSDPDEASDVSTEKFLESEPSDPSEGEPHCTISSRALLSKAPAPSLDAVAENLTPGIEPEKEAHVTSSNDSTQDLLAVRDLHEGLEEFEDLVCEQRRDPEGESENSDYAQSDPEGVETEVEEDDFLFPSGNDEEDQAEHQGLPGYDPPLYTGAPLTVGQSLIAILTFVIVHNVTGVGLADLLGLISLHCLATDNRCIKSLYLFKKYFKQMESPLKFHYFCSECFTSLESRSSVCQGENCPIDCPVSSFIEVSIIEQLANMFKRQGFVEKLSHKFQRTKQNENNYEDIYDGKLYKENMSGFLDSPNNISFTWNSDGVSIFKSSKFSIWPLYLVLNELPYSLRYKKQNTIVAGLWYGTKKPSLPMFLNVFHDDLTQLYNGINFDVPGGTKVKVKGCILCGTCDTPAKSHFLNFTSHNGYYACPVCMARGERSQRTDDHHAFPYNISPLRTTEETVQYASLADQHNSTIFGVKGPSALFLYIRNYVEATSIDVMHCLYEGVAKKLLHLWFDAEFYQEAYSLRAAADVVTSLIKDLTPPAFVTRLPRSIAEHLAYWKASEYKTWLLYYSVPILSSIMTPEYLNHHLLLIHAAYLLNQESISEDMVVEADVCLKEYVMKFSDLYHMKYITLNFHLLLHLADTVRNFGPLWTTSCMPFEDLNGQLKRLVHGTAHAELQITSSLSQVVNLPIMLSKLNLEDNIRKWSESLLHKSKIAINERIIASTMCTVGRYVKLTNVPPLIHEALLDAGVVGSVTQFFRLMKGKLLFYSKAYGRQMRTCSTAVRFKFGNQVKFGVIESFVRVSQCNCTEVCHCNAEFLSIINVLQTRNPFTIRYPQVTLPHIMHCVPQNIIAVPVKDLESVCFYFSVNNLMYLLNPVNTIENE